MSETRLFNKQAVITAIRLTAQALTRTTTREEADKVLSSLPEDLAEIVMEETVNAVKARVRQKEQCVVEALRRISQSLTEGTK